MTKNHAIFCDDVRQEITGKFILVGCYSGVLRTERFPLNIEIAALLGFFPSSAKFAIRASYELASGAELAKLEFEGETDSFDGSLVYIPLPKVPVSLSRADELILRASIDGKHVAEVARLRMELGGPPKMR